MNQKIYWPSLFIGPILYWIVRKDLLLGNFKQSKAKIIQNATYLFLALFSAYFVATGPFLFQAIREFSKLSMVLSVIVGTTAIVFNVMSYYLPVVIAILPGRNRKQFAFIWISSLIGAFWPNIGNLNAGEVLAQYAPTQFLVQIFGCELTNLLVNGFFFTILELSLQKKLKRAVVGVFGLGIVLLGFRNWIQENQQSYFISGESVNLTYVQTVNSTGGFEARPPGSPTEIQFAEKVFSNLDSYLAKRPTDLILLPESGVDVLFSNPWGASSKERSSKNSYSELPDFLMRNHAGLLSVSVENGINSRGEVLTTPVPTVSYYSQNGGQLLDFSPKTFLIPFIEYVPGAEKFPDLQKIFPWAYLKRSEIPARDFSIKGLKFRALICYDAIFSEPYMQAVRNGVDFVVSLTNNYYLHEGSHFQLSLARAHAVESGLSLIYVANLADTSVVGAVETEALTFGEFGISQVQTDALKKIPTIFGSKVYPVLEEVLPYLRGLSVSLGVLIIVLLKLFALRLYFPFYLRFLKKTLLPLFTGLLLYISVTQWGIQVVVVPTPSMWPAIQPGSKLLICRFENHYDRGDIVSAKLEENGENVIKRLILLPGDEVEGNGVIRSSAGEVFQVEVESKDGVCIEHIGNRSWEIPCAEADSFLKIKKLKMGPSQIFLLGDNRTESSDNRDSGPSEYSWLRGKPCLLSLK